MAMTITDECFSNNFGESDDSKQGGEDNDVE